ncbi:MAG: YceI family protein [Halofilum sp. (in: g-proteobacteria)]|nr:YceI family protein [Halofilum sp. (in: g-proteobacteria)]
MMRRVSMIAIAGLLFLVGQPALAAEAYVFDNNHTEVEFQWTHFGFSTTSAEFHDVSGTLMFDENDVTGSSIEVTLPIQSLKTGRDYFTAHLLSADFFDWVNHKQATFKSTSVEKGSGSNAYAGDRRPHHQGRDARGHLRRHDQQGRPASGHQGEDGRLRGRHHGEPQRVRHGHVHTGRRRRGDDPHRLGDAGASRTSDVTGQRSRYRGPPGPRRRGSQCASRTRPPTGARSPSCSTG